tara:strand:+ start:828 stop:1037 length:210 start_codon:yes stop_codon:yes gene_type:complete
MKKQYKVKLSHLQITRMIKYMKDGVEYHRKTYSFSDKSKERFYKGIEVVEEFYRALEETDFIKKKKGKG